MFGVHCTVRLSTTKQAKARFYDPFFTGDSRIVWAFLFVSLEMTSWFHVSDYFSL